jgi:hypothetical protein
VRVRSNPNLWARVTCLQVVWQHWTRESYTVIPISRHVSLVCSFWQHWARESYTVIPICRNVPLVCRLLGNTGHVRVLQTSQSVRTCHLFAVFWQHWARESYTVIPICRHVSLVCRLFGNTGHCAACSKVIPAFEMVMRARNNVYHLECFACQQCNHRSELTSFFYKENKPVSFAEFTDLFRYVSMSSGRFYTNSGSPFLCHR